MFGNTNQTPKALAGKAMEATASRQANLGAKRDAAVSQFRATVYALRDINSGLDEDIVTADEMIAFYAAQKEAAERHKADNEAVCQHILDIIGE